MQSFVAFSSEFKNNLRRFFMILHARGATTAARNDGVMSGMHHHWHLNG